MRRRALESKILFSFFPDFSSDHARTRARAQSDGKIMQIRKVNDWGLGRARKNARVSRGSLGIARDTTLEKKEVACSLQFNLQYFKIFLISSDEFF